MKELDGDKMTGTEYVVFVLEECKKQWNENQAKEYGTWDNQSNTAQEDYFNQMYDNYADLLGKCCCDCAYVALSNEGKFYCNFGDSENYEKEIRARNYCDCFEEL